MGIGLISLTDLTPDPRTGRQDPADQRIREIVRIGQLAEEAGLDVFAVGEHHHPNYAVSSPAVVLAAVARTTERIRISRTTTLIGFLDPVRVYEDFATAAVTPGSAARLAETFGAYRESGAAGGHVGAAGGAESPS